MEITYTIAGTDGQTYGPVPLSQLQAWIQEGRLNAQTNVLRSDLNAWHPAANYQELVFPGATATAPAPVPPMAGPRPFAATTTTTAQTGEMIELEARIKRGASWFFWIAGLSAINTVLSLMGVGINFILGLGVTLIIDALGKGSVIAIVLDACAVGVVVLLGYFAQKRHAWAFIVGMVLYVLDGLIFLNGEGLLPLVFHVYVLYRLFMGMRAAFEYKKLGQG